MKSSETSTKTCTTTLKLLGDYWTLRIIDSLRSGEMRFCELQRAVDNLNPVTFSNRLQRLEQAKLINRKESEDSNSVIYELTDIGREAIPVINALNRFSTKLNSPAV